jgi:hypothetical protein
MTSNTGRRVALAGPNAVDARVAAHAPVRAADLDDLYAITHGVTPR